MAEFQRRVRPVSGAESENEEARARAKALALLADMDRTEKGLTERLIRAGFSQKAAEDALDYVKGYGYVDDMRYAVRYIEKAREGKSRLRIISDLQNRGISSALIDEAMEETGEWDEKELIRKLAVKRISKYPPDDERARDKTASSLARAGFRISDIVSVLDTISETRYI